MEISVKKIRKAFAEVGIDKELQNNESYCNYINRELAAKIVDELLKDKLLYIYDYIAEDEQTIRRATLLIIKQEN